MKLSRTSRARTLLSTAIWLHAIAMAPQNATRKQARNPNDGDETDRLETMAATSPAQKGERFSTAAVMIGCVLLRPMLYSFNPATPIRKMTASLGQFRARNMTATKSRRLSARKIRSGMENRRASCVNAIKSREPSALAANAENGAWNDMRSAVAIA